MAQPDTDFKLLETMLWENGQYFLLDLHMDRLKRSAAYFSFRCDTGNIQKALIRQSLSFDASLKYRVRLTVCQKGEFEIEVLKLEEPPAGTAKAVISDKRTDKNDIFLRHKTTNRRLYDEEFALWRAKGAFDVIFTNQHAEITEGAITTVIIERHGKYLTPPLSSGVLPGVYREHLIRSGEMPIEEKVLYKDELAAADRVILVNSVRKKVDVSVSFP